MWTWDIAHPRWIGLNILCTSMSFWSQQTALLQPFLSLLWVLRSTGQEGGDYGDWVGIFQLATAQGQIFGIQWGWVGYTNLIPTELKHVLPEWPSQVAKRDNPAQGHKSHLCSPQSLWPRHVPVPGWGPHPRKMGLHRNPQPVTRKFPTCVFPQPGASRKPSPTPAITCSCQKLSGKGTESCSR